MSIIASNSYRYNYEMEFWLLKNYSANDLLNNWNEIFEYAMSEKSEENAYFIADCMDVLCEKTRILSDKEREEILDKALHDMELYGSSVKIEVA